MKNFFFFFKHRLHLLTSRFFKGLVACTSLREPHYLTENHHSCLETFVFLNKGHLGWMIVMINASLPDVAHIQKLRGKLGHNIMHDIQH